MAEVIHIKTSSQCIDNYISYALNVQGRSKLTCEKYRNDLENFFIFLLKKKKGLQDDSEVDLNWADTEFVKSIRSSDIYDYLLHDAVEKENMPATRARHLSSIKSFFKFLTNKEKIIEDNPARNIDAPNVKNKLPKYLSLDESILLLDTIRNSQEKYKVRDYAIITLFLNCGMRLSELVNINFADIESDKSKLKVTGKGSKERIVYLNDACRSALDEYLKIRLTEPSKDKNALFVSRNSRRVSNSTVQKMLEKYFKLSGLSQRGYSVHKLRHTAATLMYSTGKVDIRVLKDILGHEQLNTTQIYTHISDKNMQDAVNSNPLSNIKK
ncbi:MAG: tyrosine recombinase XerC [Clostridia bacterium]|nr:tyrosine recombinase XerC [Clostridia bacterium]